MNLDLKQDLDYISCKYIYDNWVLAKRFVNALPNYAMSSERIFKVGEAPPIVSEQFKKTCEKYNIDFVIKKATKVARIYGLSAIFLACDKGDYSNLTEQDLQNYNIRFNVLDPLNLGNLQFNQDPTSMYYQRPTLLKVNNKDVGDRRFILCINDMPLFIDFEASNLNFAGKSIFKNMREMIVLWNNLFNSLDRIALKASSIIINGGDNSGIFSGSKLGVTERSLEIFNELRQNMIALLPKNTTAEFFNLNGVTEITNMIEHVRDAFTMALSDTPISILMDKNLSSGLNEGEADFKSTIMAVDSFRNEILKPLYIYVDSFIQRLAWSDSFVKDTKLKYPKSYSNLSITQIRNKWIQDFSFEWEPLYPPSPQEITNEKTALIDNLAKIRLLGADTSSIFNELNESNFFKNEFLKGDDELQNYLQMDFRQNRE